MTEKRTIRFAVVGCGNMGARHAEIVRRMPGCQLACVCDRNAGNALKAAGGVPAETDYEAVLRRPDIDAVVLGLPSSLHASHGICAAQAGKHVITEKPIATTVADAQALVAACQKAGVVCAVISQNRFADGIAALKAALTRGDLGRPILARASVKWMRHDPYYASSTWRGTLQGEGGGVLMNQAIHNMDLMLWLFGRPEHAVCLTRNNRPVMETEDTAVAAMRFPGGLLATFEASTSAFPGFDERIEVHSLTASCIVEKGNIVFWKHEQQLPPPQPPAFPPPPDGLDPKLLTFARQYANIIAAIRGEEALMVTPEEAVAVVEWTLGLYGSSNG
jgi:predicted dehydrogenase